MSLLLAVEVYGMAINTMHTFLEAKAAENLPKSAVFDLSLIDTKEVSQITQSDVLHAMPRSHRESVSAIEIPQQFPHGMLKKIAKHDEALQKLEHWYAFCEKHEIIGAARFTDKRLLQSSWISCSKVNVILSLRSKVDKYCDQLIKMKEESLKDHPSLGVAYITFKTTSRCCAYVSVAGKKEAFGPFGRKVWFAPHPKSILWDNLGEPWVKLKCRFVITTVMLTALAMMWGSVIAFLGSADNLGNWIPLFKELLDASPELRGVVTAYLPVVALVIINALLPKLLRTWTQEFELVPDRTRREFGVLKKYFTFSLATGILLQAAAQGVGDSAQILQELDTARLYFLLASMIVPTNGYFVTAVAQAAFLGNMSRLLRVGDLVLSPIKSASALTKRELDGAYKHKQFYFSEHYAVALVIYSFTILFSVNVPYLPINIGLTTAMLEANTLGDEELSPKSPDDQPSFADNLSALSASAYTHPAKAFIPEKTDHEAMAKQKFYCNVKTGIPYAARQ
eukprot:gene23324-35720_t